MRSNLAGPDLLAMTDHAMTNEDTPASTATSSTFKTTLIRVLIVQAVALAVLALIQLLYNR